MTEREQFDEWCRRLEVQLNPNHHPEYPRSYEDYATAWAWSAWQAARATPAPAQPEGREEWLAEMRVLFGLPEGKFKMPTTADEAALMLLLSHRWLLEHAPERLTDAGRAGAAAAPKEKP